MPVPTINAISRALDRWAVMDGALPPPPEPDLEIAPDLRAAARCVVSLPLTGWLDNVRSNQEIDLHKEIARQSRRDYFGRSHGKTRERVDGEASNSHLKQYLRKIRKGPRVLADEDPADINNLEDAAMNDEQLDDEDLPPPRKKARPLVEEGLRNAKNNDVSSEHAIPEDDLVEGLERDEPTFFRLEAHQRDAVGRIEYLLNTYGACLLAEDMGLGKTVEVLAYILRECEKARNEGRSILVGIFVPPGLITTWKAELKRTTGLRYADYNDPKVRAMDAKAIRRAYDVLLVAHDPLSRAYGEVVTGYSQWQAIKEGLDDEVVKYCGRKKSWNGLPSERVSKVLLELEFHTVVVDEAHALKNQNSQFSCGMRLLRTSRRIAMTGSPLQNGLGDFSAMLLFLCFSPFKLPQLFKVCFICKASSERKGVSRVRRRLNDVNDAILARLRSCITIRRLKDQMFNGRRILNIPEAEALNIDVGLSSAAAEFQQKTRRMWDPVERARLKELKEDDREQWEEEMKGRSPNPLTDIIEARLGVCHEKAVDARYGEFGVEDLKRIKRGQFAAYDVDDELLYEDDEDEDEAASVRNAERAALAAERAAATLARRQEHELNEKEMKKLTARRSEFLAHFKAPGNEKEWRSDRLYHVVKEARDRLRQVDEMSEAESDPVQKKQIIATNKILIFSEFLSVLDLVSCGMDNDPNFGGIKHLRFDGTVHPDKRDKNRKIFEEEDKDFEQDNVHPDDARVLLVTMKAGFQGLNLVHASWVIIVAPTWNPSIEDQLACRAYRKGQENIVTIVRFYSENSIERRMRALQRTKRKQVDRVVDNTHLLLHAQNLTKPNAEQYLDLLRYKSAESDMQKGLFTL